MADLVKQLAPRGVSLTAPVNPACAIIQKPVSVLHFRVPTICSLQCFFAERMVALIMNETVMVKTTNSIRIRNVFSKLSALFPPYCCCRTVTVSNAHDSAMGQLGSSLKKKDDKASLRDPSKASTSVSIFLIVKMILIVLVPSRNNTNLWVDRIIV